MRKATLLAAWGFLAGASGAHAQADLNAEAAGENSGGAAAATSTPDDPRKLLNLLFGPPACAHVSRVCFKSPTYEVSARTLVLLNAQQEVVPNATWNGLQREQYLDAYPQFGVAGQVTQLASDLEPLLTTDEKIIDRSTRAPTRVGFSALKQAFGTTTPEPVRRAMWDYVWLNYTDAAKGPNLPELTDNEDLSVVALVTASPGADKWDSPDKPLAHLTAEYHKRGHNVEWDILLEKYLNQFRQALGPMASETPLDQGGRLFTLTTPRETAYVAVTLTHETYNTTGKVVPNSTQLVVVKSVFSHDAIRTLRSTVIPLESTNWLKRRMTATDSASEDELFEYELAAAKKLVATDPGKALENLAPLSFFQRANTEAALAIKRDALKAVEANQRAAKAEADKKAAAELALRSKRDATARKAQAEAAAKSKALLAGVNKALTPESATFDIDAAKGQVVIWQGSLMKKLFGTTYLASTGGVFWCLRLDGGASGPGYFVAKGTVTGGCKITDGIRDMNVPQLAGAFVDFP